jgi:hypothetical protein
VNGYLQLWLACSLLSACCCWRLYLCRSLGQALFTQSSVHYATATSFPLSKNTGGGDTAPAFSACVFIYSSCGKCMFPPLLWSFPPTAAFASFSAPDYWAVLLVLPASVFVHSSRERWVFPSLLWTFPPSATLASFPAPGCWVLPPSPACSVTVPGWIPSPSLRCSGRLTFFAMCLYCSRGLLLSFSFFPGWGSICPGVCQSGRGLSVGVPRTTKLTLSASSQAVWARVTGGRGPFWFLRLI